LLPQISHSKFALFSLYVSLNFSLTAGDPSIEGITSYSTYYGFSTSVPPEEDETSFTTSNSSKIGKRGLFLLAQQTQSA